MLNQSTVAIITGIISVIGALVGVALGALLSSRQTLKMEEIKLKQEKVKRNTQIIEEVYQTLIRVDDLCDAFAYDIINSEENLDSVSRIKEIRTNLERVKTLIWLYFPMTIIMEFNGYMDIIGDFWNKAGTYYAERKKEGHLKDSSNLLDGSEKKLMEAQTAYKRSLKKFQGQLEKLVKER